MLIYRTRPPTADTHKPQIKGKRKGSRDFPFRVGPLLAAGVSRASSATWAPSARPLVTLLHHLWPSAFTTRLFTGVPRSPLPHVLTRAQNFDVRLSTRPLSPSALTLSLVLRPLKTSFSKNLLLPALGLGPVLGAAFSQLTLRSALSWRVASVSPPIGRGHAPLPQLFSSP